MADNGMVSHPFTIGGDVFDRAARQVQRVFYYQRAFTAVVEPHAEGPWTHATDAALAPSGVRGGWHDAGDYSLYNSTTVASLFWLLETYNDFRPDDDDTNIPESGNGVPDLLDEIRWGLEWVLSVQEPSGGFANSTCLDAYGAYGTYPPERASGYRRGEVGTMATARAVGILAYASSVFAGIDDEWSRRLLASAARGWTYLEARPGEHSDGPTCAAYRQDGNAQFGRAVRMFASAGMLVATGAARYRDAFEAVFDAIDSEPSVYRFNTYACLLYLRATAGDQERKDTIRVRLETRAGVVLADADRHPFEWAGRYLWGSIAAGFERVGAFTVRMCLADPRAASAHCRLAVANLDYVFGRNLYQVALVSGLEGVTRERQWAFHHWLASLRAQPYLFPGAVASGPNQSPESGDRSRLRSWPLSWGYWDDPAMPRNSATPVDGRFTDNDSWSTNEVAIHWQSVSVYNLAFAVWASRSGLPLPSRSFAASRASGGVARTMPAQ